MRPAGALSESGIQSRDALSGDLGTRHAKKRNQSPGIGESEPQLKALCERCYASSAAILRISASLDGTPVKQEWQRTALARSPSHPTASPLAREDRGHDLAVR